ncbi:hypothetical protein AX16_010083 [Volvariella volvacea WC 439]|nr:hypothetical protein AX16_010083 [Volvariella volvacea WC 439]
MVLIVFALAKFSLDILSGEYKHVGFDSPIDVRIDFERLFVTPPKVVIFVNHIAFYKSTNWSLVTKATNIDTNGFTLTIESWAGTTFYGAIVGRITYHEDRKNIFSTSVNTMDIRSPDWSQHKHGRPISFGNFKFLERPNVFMAINQFDFSHQANLRLNTYVDDVSTNGVTWNIDSWSDSVLHSAGVTIIAA